MALKIFSASAGSGKTHRLTIEYLLLCFQNPENFRHILAVTFTNKATAEMKSRIVNELFKIASGEESAVFADIKENMPGKSELFLRLRAQDILRHILYSYHHFNVSTIDSFFQVVMRAFTRELGIHSGYNLELDTEMVLEEASDRLISQAGKDEYLIDWLISFATEKFNEEQKWNYKKDIQTLAPESLKEKFALFSSRVLTILEDKDKLNQYLDELKKIINDFEYHQKSNAVTATRMITSAGLEVNDFSYKNNGVAGWLFKLLSEPDKEPGKRVSEAIDDPSKWFSSSSGKDIKNRIETLLNNGLLSLTTSLYDYHRNHIMTYQTARLIKQNIYVLGIIGYLNREIIRYRTENNVLMLSDVNQLLYQMTESEEAPFIYEKTGYWLNHLFIDEFQDTSAFQWHNLLVLLKNNLASGYNNLVVGDVKQSIYRWRGGDWSLLLHKIYNDIDHQLVKNFNLDVNYRSCPEIIAFNNQLFRLLSDFLPEKFLNLKEGEKTSEEDRNLADIIRQAYRDVVQNIPENKENEKGFVQISFIKSDENANWKAKVREMLPDLLYSLLQDGYEADDMAILTRTNSEGQEITSFLLENTDFTIVSQETLAIGSSVAIRFVVSCLKYYLDAEDKLNLADLLFSHNLLFNESSQNPDIDHLLNYIHGKEENEILSKLREVFSRHAALSLYALTELIISSFNLYQFEREQAYLSAFLNLILDFSAKFKQSVTEFIEYWEEKAHSLPIRISDETKGLKVMTIHKSKGLQFKIVIIPYCNWSIDHLSGKTQIVWCRPEEKPFDMFPVVPVRYGQRMKDSIFHKEYYEEKLYAWMDNLNAMYVAFTRAEKRLYVFSELNGKGSNSTDRLLYEMLTTRFQNQNIDVQKTDFEEVYSFGRPEKNKVKGRASGKADIISLPQRQINVEMPEIKAGSFKNMLAEKNQYSQLERGKKLHYILSKIKTAEQVGHVINELCQEGELKEEEKEEVKKLIIKIVNHPEISDWFSENWEVITEKAILIPGRKYKIPDRVVIQDQKAVIIDFKFSEPDEKHNRQVEEYAALMKEMGYSPVSACLVYVNTAGEPEVRKV